MDCVRTAIRLGAEKVSLIYRRTIAEMPADQIEIEESLLEGVEFLILTNPLSVSQDNDKVSLKLTKMELGEPDASGRRSPRPVAGSEYTMELDYVISAIGQTQDLSFIDDDCNVSTSRDRIAADSHTAMTNIDGVFVSLDSVTGPQTAILAIAGGKRAALAMSQYMNGKGITAEEKFYNHVKAKDNKEIDPATFDNIETIDKINMPVLTKEQRHHNFEEVELGFSEMQAKREAARCLSCGCADVDECKLRQYASKYEVAQFAFSGEMTTHPMDDSHQYIARDRNKCILCARCVRICMETGSGVFGFVGRGFDTTVEPPFSMPLGEEKNCISCGLCVSTCPTGALSPKKDVTLPTTAYSDSVHFDSGDVKVTDICDAVEQTKKAGF
jgi:formate dehydrogenase major subunit